MSIATSAKSMVTLTRSADWHRWIEGIRTLAESSAVWPYIDPQKEEELVEPEYPMPGVIREGVTDIEKLTPNEADLLKAQRSQYKRKTDKFDQQVKAIGHLRTHIQNAVAEEYQPYTYDCETARQMLKELKKRLCPTDKVRRVQLIEQYRQLRKAPKASGIDKWLRAWEKICKEADQLNLLEISGERCAVDFLNTVSGVSPDFASYHTNRMEDPGLEPLSIYTLIDKFRTHQDLLKATQKGSSHSAFSSTLQGKKTSAEDSESSGTQQNKKRSPSCFCGEKHWYSECPYIIKEVQPKGWKPDPAIQEEYQKKLKEDEKFKQTVERNKERRKNWAKRDQKKKEKADSGSDKEEESFFTATAPASFLSTETALSTDSYALKKSYILDSGSTIHVCNNPSRFLRKLRPAQSTHKLFARNNIISIEE